MARRRASAAQKVASLRAAYAPPLRGRPHCRFTHETLARAVDPPPRPWPMASDGNWVSAPAKRRGVVDYVKLKYYHWCLWTGIYMLDTRERAALNSIVLVLLALLARYVHRLFFLGEL